MLNWAILQFNATASLDHNKQTIERLLEHEQVQRSDVVCLPECCLYRAVEDAPLLRYPITDVIIPWFQAIAQCLSKWLIVGSFFEWVPDSGKAKNTCVVINPSGDIVEMYHKMHLFDVDLPDVEMHESRQFLAGDCPKIVEISGFKVGLSICFDCRFPELYRYYAQQGCHVLCIPSSFTTVTGQQHWSVLCRARAIENQCYVMAPNQYGRGANGVDTYGHSLIVDPLGHIIEEAPMVGDTVLGASLSLKRLADLRQSFPVLGCRKMGLLSG